MRTVALSLLTTAAIAGFAINSATAQIPWQENLRTAHSQAQAEGKLLLLHFYSDNCVWCDRLEAGSFRDPTVGAAISKRFVPVKVHGGKNPKLTSMFKVSAFPTDVIVTTEGKTLSHKVSPQDPARYINMLSSVVAVPASTVAAAPPAAVAPAGQPTATLPSYAQAKAAAPPRSQVAPPAPAVAALPAQVQPPALTVSGPALKTNQFALPSGKLATGGVNAQLAGSRSDSMTLDMPAATAVTSKSPAAKSPAPTSSAAKPPAAAPAEPELAMEGYCPVTVIKEDRWIEGNPKFGVIHLGKLYLFSDADKMQIFLADPVPFTPVLNEIDVVRFFEERVIVKGKREWGLKDPTYNRMFFFEDEAAMNHFWNEYERYTGAAIEVMEKAISDANPGA